MSTIKIEGWLTGALNIKRMYMPGVTITVTCPECSDERSQDMGARYISHPKINEPIEHDLYCPACEHEWSESVFLDVSYYVLDETARHRPGFDRMRLRGAIADCVQLDTMSRATASRLLAILDGPK